MTIGWLSLTISTQPFRVAFRKKNLSTSTVPFPERRQPTLQENIESVFAGVGGNCITLNSVMYVLLLKLGFDVQPDLASCGVNGNYDHVINIVRNVKRKDDKYLIDVGTSRQILKLINLDFDKESAVIMTTCPPARYVKRGVTFIRQERRGKNGPKVLVTEGDWENFVYFTLQDITLEQVAEMIKKTSCSNPGSFCNTVRRISGTHKETGKYVAIMNAKLMIEGDGKKMQKSIKLVDDDAVVEAVKMYFPSFPSDTVRKSYQTWHSCDRYLNPFGSL